MTEEFDEARDEAFIIYFKKAILPKSFVPHKKPFEDGADWAYEWCKEHPSEMPSLTSAHATFRKYEAEVQALKKEADQLRAQLAIARGGLEEMAKKPYADSDSESLLLWIEARAKQALDKLDTKPEAVVEVWCQQNEIPKFTQAISYPDKYHKIKGTLIVWPNKQGGPSDVK